MLSQWPDKCSCGCGFARAPGFAAVTIEATCAGAGAGDSVGAFGMFTSARILQSNFTSCRYYRPSQPATAEGRNAYGEAIGTSTLPSSCRVATNSGECLRRSPTLSWGPRE